VTARVLYLQRDQRGARLTALRLVGPGTDERWDVPAGGADGPEAFAAAADWVRDRLASTRSSDSISMLCLDGEGTACTWLTGTGADPQMVAMLARVGSGETGAPGGGAFDFYAPSAEESTIQALPGTGTARMPVIAASEVPGRLLIDALDGRRIPTEAVCTLQHAMAAAWDPSARVADPSPGQDETVVASDAPLTAIVMADPVGRLCWCWSRAGSVLTLGMNRVRVHPASGDEPARMLLGSDDASRLTTEWLSWGAQLSASPRRVICVGPDDDSLGDFGRALSALWPGATIDAAPVSDPVGATLRRLAERLEATPRTAVAAPSPASGLVELSARPGLRHRRMYLWRAVAVAALAAVVAAGGWRLRAQAQTYRESAAAWENHWREVIKTSYPDALSPRPGMSPAKILADEVRRREQLQLPPERTDVTMPVLQELETVTMIIGHQNYSLESVELDSAKAPRLVVIAPTLRDAEALHESLKRIGGSYVTTWQETYREQADGEQKVIRAEFRGDWNRDAVKALGARP